MVLFIEEAKLDLEEALEFYRNTKNENLEHRFLESVDNVISIISKNPYLFPLKFKDSRSVNLKVFPFQIHYKIDNNIIYVIGVFHHKLNPKTWEREI